MDDYRASTPKFPRGFEDHTVPVKPLTIVVGRNNAGKSTVVEALRLISIVISRFRGELDRIPLRWEFPKSRRGPTPYKDLEINFESICYCFRDPPASVQATFANGTVLEVEISPDSIVARKKRGKRDRDKANDELSRVSILPQVAPVAREERLLTDDYVRSALSSILAPLHFRNQLYLLREYFDLFKEAAERTWPGLRIERLELIGEPPDPRILSLFVRDGGFTGEIAWMGHGLQMWLQMIWFLCRAENHETVILDEPDVYMHADLQRRLVQFIKKRHHQIIVATHSSEIMAEVLPEHILVIDRSRDRSDFAGSIPAVQRVLNGFGSIHNLQLSRLWNARRFLIIEGKDVQLLKQFQNKLFSETRVPVDTVPSSPVGGWGGWDRAVGSDILLKNAGGDGIITYSIFDSDYFPESVLERRRRQADQRGISLHVWTKKEIENFVLVPTAIQRSIFRQLQPNEPAPTVGAVEKQMEIIAENLKDETIDAFATQILSEDRKLTVASVNQQARKIVVGRWCTLADRLGVISGKVALSAISRWAQENFKVSLSAGGIVHNMLEDEVSTEMRDVLLAIEEGEPFQNN